MKDKLIKILLLIVALLSTSACDLKRGATLLGWFVFIVMILAIIYLVIEKNKEKESGWEE